MATVMPKMIRLDYLDGELVKQETQDEMIDRVSALRHWTAQSNGGSGFTCRCEECRAIKQVCALAREALEMKQARRRRGAR